MTPLLAEINWAQIVVPLVGSILLCYGVFQVVMDTRRGERKRVMDRLRGEGGRQKKVEAMSLLKRDTDSAEDVGVLINQTIGRLSFIPKLQTMLEQASLPWSAQKLVSNLLAGSITLTAVMLYFGINLVASLSAGLTLLIFPIVYVGYRRKSRMRKLVHQLPDVFDMMAQALRAGHSLASAIHLIQEQMPDPISTEFGRVFHEQNLGIKIEDALLAMADRVDSLDVRMFVTAVLIQRTTGGDLAEILDKISTVIRGRIELYGLVNSLTSEGRLSGWVLLALPIVVFIACTQVNYSYVSMLWTHPYGKIMLATAAGMQLMGLAMIRWIVNIKV